MSLSKEQFISVLREVTLAEFSNIPQSESDIMYSFSKSFELRMKKLIHSQKKSYWNLINTASKKVAIVFIAFIAFFCSILSIKPIRASAIEVLEDIIIKTKNIFQIAYEKGIPLSEVDTEGNFKHTDFKDEPKENVRDEITNALTGEEFEDEKTQIYNKMLNTIDFFNTAEVSADIHMSEDENLTIDYYTNIDASLAYQAIYDHGVLTCETYCSPNSEFLTLVDNKNKTYNQYYLKVYHRSDSPYIPLEERILYDDATGDGLPIYTYRRNITNCTMASYTLFPEGLTFSYLADFERWEIGDDNADYLGRKCIKIVGKPNPYTGDKHNNDNFVMLVDEQTGIILKFEGYKNGKITRHLTVTKCIIDGNPTIKKFNINEYNSYTESSIYYQKRN